MYNVAITVNKISHSHGHYMSFLSEILIDYYTRYILQNVLYSV